MNYQLLPKVELHLHLDCCLSYRAVQQLNPAKSHAEYLRDFVAPPKCTDLADYITRAIKGFELMQTKDQLRLVTLDLFEQLAADNVLYAELRFAPLQHLAGRLTAEEVVQTVNEAVQTGIAQTGVLANIILCTLRHYSEAQSLQTVKLVHQFAGSHVVGFDIAADEAGYPIDEHISSFSYARKNGIRCTAHAGEARGADSVWETLQHLHPARIGHGVRSAEDARLMQHLKERHIHLEVCPTSNIQVNIFDNINKHTADVLYRSGISMGINTDARTISNTTLANEYKLLEDTFGWTPADFLQCNLQAAAHCFADEATKKQLRQKLLAAYEPYIT